MRSSLIILFLLWSFQGVPYVYCEEEGAYFGTAISSQGEVFVTRGMLEFEAKGEERFRYGDEIETGEDGSLQISFESSYISVGPKTIFSLGQREEKGKTWISLFVDEGRIRSRVLDLEKTQGYEVVSDGGAARVKGTDFVAGYTPDKNRAFAVVVLGGVVEVHPPELAEEGETPRFMEVRENHQCVTFQEGRTLPQPRLSSITEQEVNEIKDALPLPGDKKKDEKVGDMNVALPMLDEINIEELVVAVATPPEISTSIPELGGVPVELPEVDDLVPSDGHPVPPSQAGGVVLQVEFGFEVD
ncbi:MAG: FecR domain-containing protein [Planctomycetes bacterium]|nr:FecR domain-containing protein [Planctomycetota bacterium]